MPAGGALVAAAVIPWQSCHKQLRVLGLAALLRKRYRDSP
jgi:hypothetical protein